MPKRFVRQPNGLLAEFSTVVDHFTAYDMTEAEAVDHARVDMGIKDAFAKVHRGMTDEPLPPFIEASGRGDGLDRFRDAIRTIELIHGEAAARKADRVLSAPPGDSSRGTI